MVRINKRCKSTSEFCDSQHPLAKQRSKQAKGWPILQMKKVVGQFIQSNDSFEPVEYQIGDTVFLVIFL